MKILEVIYENGVFRPLSEIFLDEKKHFKILITEEDISLAELFSGIIKGLNNEIIDLIALDAELENE